MPALLKRFGDQYLTLGQTVAFDFHGTNLLFRVGALEALDLGTQESSGKVTRGMLCSQTRLLLAKMQGSPIVLTGLESQGRKTIFKQDFSFRRHGHRRPRQGVLRHLPPPRSPRAYSHSRWSRSSA